MYIFNMKCLLCTRDISKKTTKENPFCGHHYRIYRRCFFKKTATVNEKIQSLKEAINKAKVVISDILWEIELRDGDFNLQQRNQLYKKADEEVGLIFKIEKEIERLRCLQK